MIKIEQVTKTFGNGDHKLHAVNGVDLTIMSGEIYGIIGFSGAGKSTLVRCMNLLERPTKGKVYVDGVELTGLNDKKLRQSRKKIGMIFQHFNLLRSRSVYHNILFPLKKSTLTKAEKEQKITQLLELVGLTDKRNAYPSKLSGGQKQRVAIARALANDPKVLLCDEATSALDPQTTKSILNLLKRVNEELGLTIVMITHEMAVVRDICDRVAIMEQGRVMEAGRTIDVFSRPKEKLTRAFIDTASNISQIYELVKNEHELTRIVAGEKIVLLTYSGGSTGEPLISYLAKQFMVTTNIIYGNVDVLKGTPLGKLVVTLGGKAESIMQAIAYIKDQNVQVEVIKE